MDDLESIPPGFIECADCGAHAKEEDSWPIGEEGRICGSCDEKRQAEHESLGRALYHAYKSEKFYREEGLLRPDGTWDVEALRRLKR